MTILGISGCTALLLTGFGIRDSVSSLIDIQYNKIHVYDSMLILKDEQSTTNEDMTDDGLEAYLNNRIAGLTNMTIIDSGIYQEHDKTFAKLVATDANTYYNIRFFTLENKLVTIEFNTQVGVYKEWEDVANEVMNSICFNEEDIKKIF